MWDYDGHKTKNGVGIFVDISSIKISFGRQKEIFYARV
jgi:hypothetical protein